MTRDDIIRMAQEAGIPFNKWGLVGCEACESDIDENLERFAALVAAAEREAILKQADSLGWVSVEAIRGRGET